MQTEVSLTVFERGKKKPEYTLDSDIRGQITAKEFIQIVKNTLIRVAINAREEETAKGFDKNAITLVDNKYGRSVQDVSPLGKIEYIARQDLREIITFAYDKIVNLTRIITKTGEYAKNNIVLYNGTEIASNKEELLKFLKIKTEFKNNDKIEFVNIKPYASMLEKVGLTGGGRKGQVKPKKGVEGPARIVKKPNGVYYLAHRSIKAKYKGNSFIKFQPILGQELGLVSPPDSKNGKYGQGRIRQKGPSAGKTYVYPAILILIKTDGVLQ